MKRQLTIILACLSMIAFSSCKEDDGSYVNRVPIFNVTGPENTEGTEISISGKAQTVNFTVMATGEWTASVSKMPIHLHLLQEELARQPFRLPLRPMNQAPYIMR